jgi:hypothetical protein
MSGITTPNSSPFTSAAASNKRSYELYAKDIQCQEGLKKLRETQVEVSTPRKVRTLNAKVIPDLLINGATLDPHIRNGIEEAFDRESPERRSQLADNITGCFPGAPTFTARFGPLTPSVRLPTQSTTLLQT